MSVVGQDIPHESARGHVTGESLFIDDIPPRRDELFLEFLGSPVAHGRLLRLDIEEASQVPGVVAILTAKDIPGHNKLGPIVADEHLLADDVVTYIGDPLAIVAAESRLAAERARKLIRAEITSFPALLSLREALDAGSFLGPIRSIQSGNLEAVFANAERTHEGELEIGGQEHFYLEAQSAIAYPGEQQILTVISSTQHPSEVQAVIAEVLGWSFNRVTVECRRMGGGFGGKETQAAQPAAMAALVAAHTGRPARIVLSRDDDMAYTGKRHPFLARYRVGFRESGEIQALQVELFSDGGCTTDLSPSVLERAMLHVDNAYFLPAVRITGRVCKTNLPSNTAFRGFGGPQGVACIENILEEIARLTTKDSYDVRQLNCYRSAPYNSTPYGQLVENNVLPRLLKQLRDSSQYDKRRQEIVASNADNKALLRGISMTPVKFGISFTKTTLNQANALVNVYTDGTVLVSTGATEMGQGVHTRVRQLVADDLGVPYEAVIISITSTDKNNNTSPTAASCGTDLNGAAALDATARIRGRLARFVAARMLAHLSTTTAAPEHVKFEQGEVWDERHPEHRLLFRDVVREAYLERISLGERGFYATPGIGWDRDTGRGSPFLYFTNGAAVAEIQINRFTGELHVPRVDILMDVGLSINPGIDRGQVLGGFIQGMGWVTTEQLKYDAHGALLSHSPTTYKIPNISDVPADFRVEFLDNRESTLSLRGSKAVGEPPLLLGISVWTAIRRAILEASARGIPRLQLPATHERILLALQ